MNSQTTATAVVETTARYHAAIETARKSRAALEKLQAELLDAARHLAQAHDDHVCCGESVKDLNRTYTAYQTAKDKLAGIAINFTRMEDAATADLGLLKLYTEQMHAQTTAARNVAIIDVDEQTLLLHNLSYAMAKAADSGDRHDREWLYETEENTYAALDRRVAELLVSLTEGDHALAETWDGDPAAAVVLDYVRSLSGTPFEPNDDDDAYTPGMATR